jgi:hypothetical protein
MAKLQHPIAEFINKGEFMLELSMVNREATPRSDTLGVWASSSASSSSRPASHSGGSSASVRRLMPASPQVA